VLVQRRISYETQACSGLDVHGPDSRRLVCSWAAPARAEEWSKTYTLAGKPDLRVDTSDATFTSLPGTRKRLKRSDDFRLQIGNDGIRIEEHQTGDMVEINVRYPHHDFTIGWSNHSVDINIHMPREGRVDLRTGDGKIELGNFKARCNCTAEMAREIDGVDGKLRATTGDGHIAPTGALTTRPQDWRRPRGCARNDRLGAGHGLEARSAMARSRWKCGESGCDVELHTGDGHIDLDLPVTTEARFAKAKFAAR